jgi:hypothetical protein
MLDKLQLHSLAELVRAAKLLGIENDDSDADLSSARTALIGAPQPQASTGVY